MSTVTVTDPLEALLSDDDWEPIHIAIGDATVCLCGVLVDSPDLPWDEVGDEDSCPTCLAIYRARYG